MVRPKHTGGVGSILTAKGGGGAAGDELSFVGAFAIQAASNNSWGMTLPTGWAAGDILLCTIVGLSTTARQASEIPANWLSLGTYVDPTAKQIGVTIFAKIAEAGETGVGVVGYGARTGVIAAYRPTKAGYDLRVGHRPYPVLRAAGIPGLVTTPSMKAPRKGRLVVASVGDVTSGANTIPTSPAGMTERVNFLYSGFHRHYLFDGVVNKGDDISRAVQWSSASGSNVIAGTFAILL